MINRGYLKLIMGCMFAGKTEELIKEYYKWKNIKNVLVINYLKDNRYGDDDFLYSHNNNKIPCKRVLILSEIDDSTLINNDIILINEGQFFCDLVEKVTQWCEKYHKIIYVAGLDGNFKRDIFPSILNLIPKVNEIIKLKSLCSLCGNGQEAIFTMRLTNEKEVELIGSSNYISVCRDHYLKSFIHNNS